MTSEVKGVKFEKYTPKISLQKIGSFAVGTNAACMFSDSGVGKCSGGVCYLNDNYGTGSDSKNWAVCEYEFDFKDYSSGNFSNFSAWLRSIYSGLKCEDKSADEKKSCRMTARRFLDSNIFYSTIYDFYNQIYNKNIYEKLISSNPFSTISLKTINSYKDDFIVEIITSSFGSIYEDNSLPNTIVETLKGLLINPIPEYTSEGKYRLRFYLSYALYKELIILDDSGKLIYTSNLLNNFFRDVQGKIGNVETEESSPAGKPTFENLKILNFNIIKSIGNTPDTILYTTENVQKDTFNRINPDLYADALFGNVELQIDIQSWSPMTMIYFLMNNIIPMVSDPSILGGKSGTKTLPFTLPMAIYKSKTKEEKINLAEALCKIDYVKPPFMFGIKFEDYFLLKDSSGTCQCLTSTLPSVSESSFLDIGAMCFDKNCGAAIKERHGLTNDTCKPFCKKIYDLIHGSGSVQSRNLNAIDQQAYAEICGVNFNPYTADQYDMDIVKAGTVITISIFFTILSFCFSRKYSIATTFMTSIALAIISGGITVFLAIDLAGDGSCQGEHGRSITCTSKITKMVIPNRFCPNFKLNCECEFNDDCGGGCVCASQTCVPRFGQRNFKTIKRNRYDGVGIVSTCVVTLLIALCYIFIRRTYGWKSNLPLLIILLLGGVILGFYLNEKENVDHLDGECCAPNCEGKGCNEDDGCGGQCPCPDYSLDEQTSIPQNTPSSDTNSQCNDGKCSNACPCPQDWTCVNGKCENYRKVGGTIIGNIIYNDDNITGNLNECLALCDNDRRCLGLSRSGGIPDSATAGCGPFFTPGIGEDGQYWDLSQEWPGNVTYIKNIDPKNFKGFVQNKRIDGYDFHQYNRGEDFRKANNLTLPECKNMCNSLPNCNAVMVDPRMNDTTKGECIFKTSAKCTLDANGKQTCTGGPVDTSWNIYYNTEQGDWIHKPNSDLGEGSVDMDLLRQDHDYCGGSSRKKYYWRRDFWIDNVSVEDCKNYCNKAKQCAGFAYNKAEKRCHFKKSGIPNRTDTNFDFYAKRVDDPISKFEVLPNTDIGINTGKPNEKRYEVCELNVTGQPDCLPIRCSADDSRINLKNIDLSHISNQEQKEVECSRQCLNTDGCMAATLNKTNNKCTFHYNWKATISNGDTTTFIKKSKP
jgi:hypothetical protein